METWYCTQGTYPYLADVTAPEICLTMPLPPVFWQGGQGYPHCPQTPAAASPVGCFACTERLRTVTYGGTMEAFQRIAFGTHWRDSAGFDCVICTDGTIIL
ncbi:MAG: hypothetical protein IJN11_02050 [Oscillospiraceae bacterium]|nr:hypothetical protein [Oscillospiraceae bacterium]